MAKTVTFDVIARSTSSGFDKTNRDLEQQQKQLKLISTAAVGLGPALVPIAAGAAAAGASLAALGVTGVLAFKGIQKEIAAGTPVGKAYSATLGVLDNDLHTIERTAAKGVLTGFQAGARDVHSLLPLVNADTGALSIKLGDIVSHVGPGLVRLFTAANPLLLQFAGDLDKGAAKFDQWTASSDGATKFVQFAQKELPQVEQTFLSLAKSGAHIVEGLAPLGGGSLTTLRVFSDVVNHIPVGVLQALAPALVALKVAGTVSAGVNNLSISLGKMTSNLAAGAGAGGIVGLGVAAAATAISIAKMSDSGRSLRDVIGKAAATSSDFETALIASNGAVDANVKSNIALSLQQSGLADKFAKSGISLGTLTGAVTGSDAQWKQLSTTWLQSGAANLKLVGSLGQTRVQFQQGKVDAAALGQVLTSTATYTTGLTTAQQGLVNQVMSSTTQIGYLNAALDKFSNFALDAEQQELKLRDSFAQAGQTLKGNGAALNDVTTKGRANKEWLLTEIQAINSHVSAVGKQTGSVKAATAALAGDEAGLRRAAAAAGLNTQQVNALIRQYALTPKQVSTVIRASTSQALAGISGVQAALNNLQAEKVIHITEVTNKIAAGSAGTNLAARASGGRVQAGHQYLVNEVGEELYVRDGDGTALIRGGPHMWRAPGNGQIINAATVRGIRSRISSVASASLQALPSAAKSAISALGNILPSGSPITRTLQAEDKQLEAVARQRAQIADKLKAANSKLAAAWDLYRQEAAKVKSGVLASFDITTAGRDVFGQVTAGGILADLQSKVNQAALFEADLKALSGKLDKGLYQQLAEAGPDASLPTLQALIAAQPGQLKQINTLEGKLGTLGGQAGTTVANDLYIQQIKADQQLARSLQAQQRATDKLEKRLQSVLARGLNITIQGGDAKTIVRELERYFASGGTLNSSGRIR